MVFRKKDSDRKGKKNTKKTSLYSSKTLPEILQVPNTIDSPIFINDSQIKSLVEFFTATNNTLPNYMEYYKALNLIKLRQKQLDETKKVVYSLRETDQTSKEALDFLKEKLDILSTERDDLAMYFLTFRESLDKCLNKHEIIQHTMELVSKIKLVDTKSWEEGLDYFRIRFLLQREQEDADQELKDKFIPEDITDITDISISKLDKQEEFTRDRIVIEYQRKHKANLDLLIKEYNEFLKNFPPRIEEELEEDTLQDVKLKITMREDEAFAVGKELYILKREQGILTLKTYEIIQTIRSRLLNITGSIASRKFLHNTFNELLEITKSAELSAEVMKVEILKRITRLLRIIGEIAPNDH